MSHRRDTIPGDRSIKLGNTTIQENNVKTTRNGAPKTKTRKRDVRGPTQCERKNGRDGRGRQCWSGDREVVPSPTGLSSTPDTLENCHTQNSIQPWSKLESPVVGRECRSHIDRPPPPWRVCVYGCSSFDQYNERWEYCVHVMSHLYFIVCSERHAIYVVMYRHCRISMCRCAPFPSQNSSICSFSCGYQCEITNTWFETHICMLYVSENTETWAFFWLLCICSDALWCADVLHFHCKIAQFVCFHVDINARLRVLDLKHPYPCYMCRYMSILW